MPEERRKRKLDISFLLNEEGSQNSDNKSTSSAYRSEVLAAAEAGGSSRRRRRDPGQLTAAVPVAKVPRTSDAVVVAAGGRRRSTGPIRPTVEAPRAIAAVVTSGGSRRSTGPIGPTAEAPRTSAAASSSGAAVNNESGVQYVEDKFTVAQLPEFRKFLGEEPKGSKLFNNLVQIGARDSKVLNEKDLYEFYLSRPGLYHKAKLLYENKFHKDFKAFMEYAKKYRRTVNTLNVKRGRKNREQAGTGSKRQKRG